LNSQKLNVSGIHTHLNIDRPQFCQQIFVDEWCHNDFHLASIGANVALANDIDVVAVRPLDSIPHARHRQFNERRKEDSALTTNFNLQRKRNELEPVTNLDIAFLPSDLA
jgi:hypothetical protein